MRRAAVALTVTFEALSAGYSASNVTVNTQQGRARN